jgi:hypothetical protein
MSDQSSSPELPDPLDRLEALDRRTSVRQAWQLAVGFPVVTILVWVLLDLTLGDTAATRIIPTVVAMCGPVTAGLVVLRKWRRYQWWQPFMGALWWLIPFFLIIFTTLPVPLIAGH